MTSYCTIVKRQNCNIANTVKKVQCNIANTIKKGEYVDIVKREKHK